MLEKRRRVVQFFKAGLEMPHSDKPFKSQDSDNVSSEMESDSYTRQPGQDFDKIDVLQPRTAQREVLSNGSISLDSSPVLVCSAGLGTNSRHSPTLPAKEVSEEKYDRSMLERRNSTTTSSTADYQNNIKSKVYFMFFACVRLSYKSGEKNHT